MSDEFDLDTRFGLGRSAPAGSNDDARFKLGPNAAEPSVGTTKPGLKDNSAVMALQQMLTTNPIIRLPVSNNPGDQAYQPDGGWGPVSNASLIKFINKVLQDAQANNDNSSQLVLSVNQLLKSDLVNQDYRATQANVEQIANILRGSGRGFATKFAPDAPNVQNGVKSPQAKQIWFLPEVKMGDKTIQNFPVNSAVFASPEAFESVLLYMDMIKRDSSGQDRAAQIHEAITAVRQAITDLDPTHPEVFQATQEKLLEFDTQLEQKYNGQGARVAAVDWIKSNFADKLGGLQPNELTALTHQLVENLKAERVVDNNGYIKDQSLMLSWAPRVQERIEEWINERGGNPTQRRAR